MYTTYVKNFTTFHFHTSHTKKRQICISKWATILFLGWNSIFIKMS